MLNFIVQTHEDKAFYDFTFELERSKEFYDEWMPDEELTIKHCNYKECPRFLTNGKPEDYIPVGSVEFVANYIYKYFPHALNAITPLNVPECLFGYAHRWIENVFEPADMAVFEHERDLHGKCKQLYRKNMFALKDPRNGLFPFNSPDDFIGFQVSEEVPIESEWRVIVFHNEIMHIGNYSGDCTLFPSINTIESMIELYANNGAPVCYTLDVGVRGEATFVIECHRFFSCGLYGFSNYKRFPKMLSQTWHEMITPRHDNTTDI